MYFHVREENSDSQVNSATIQQIDVFLLLTVRVFLS
jgi:hypothetical protein